ncbi:MAG TPA: hypothetical protein VLT34_00635 [Arthrobacter sp.]|nr:hypothetical protein [Arthrobacter sp.]
MSGMSVLDPPVERHRGFNDALHPDRPWVRMLRFAVGAFVLAALARKTYDATIPGNDVDIAQLYSEFTVQSNLVLGLVLVSGAVLPRARLPEWWDHLFGAGLLSGDDRHHLRGPGGSARRAVVEP